MRTKFLFTVLLLLVCVVANAQKIKIKKDTVLADGKEVYSINYSGWTGETTIYKLNTESELIFARINGNGTPNYTGDDFLTINFFNSNKKLVTSITRFGKGLVKWLFENKVLDINGNVNEEKVDLLIKKYAMI